MADLAARREARRRKILEQSENRLNRINGVEQRSTKSELDGIVKNHVVEEPEISSFSDIFANHVSNIDVSAFASINNLLNSSNQGTINAPTVHSEAERRAVQSDEALKTVFSKYRLKFISVIALLLSFVLVVLDINFFAWGIDSKSIYLNKIFVPLLCLEMYDLYYKNVDSNTPDIFTSLLLMANNNSATPRVVLFVTRYMRCLTQVIKDVMVYFFVFNLSHYVFQMVLL